MTNLLKEPRLWSDVDVNSNPTYTNSWDGTKYSAQWSGETRRYLNMLYVGPLDLIEDGEYQFDYAWQGAPGWIRLSVGGSPVTASNLMAASGTRSVTWTARSGIYELLQHATGSTYSSPVATSTEGQWSLTPTGGEAPVESIPEPTSTPYFSELAVPAGQYIAARVSGFSHLGYFDKPTITWYKDGEVYEEKPLNSYSPGWRSTIDTSINDIGSVFTAKVRASNVYGSSDDIDIPGSVSVTEPPPTPIRSDHSLPGVLESSGDVCEDMGEVYEVNVSSATLYVYDNYDYSTGGQCVNSEIITNTEPVITEQLDVSQCTVSVENGGEFNVYGLYSRYFGWGPGVEMIKYEGYVRTSTGVYPAKWQAVIRAG